ncbi:peptidase inhibitor family I36 protein [Streptomyces sp. NPDC051130]|uniref:peptidase inhibitor family I36 protein n=1 Tax=Streptomyces sp. NPDC051130 TaxID=3157223 RepID=UPI00341455D4
MIQRVLKLLIAVSAILGLAGLGVTALAATRPTAVTVDGTNSMPYAIEDFPHGPPAADWPVCATGRLCVYTDTGGQGAALAGGPGDPLQLYSSQWNDQVSSVHNNSPYWACVYEDPYYGGTVQALRPGYQGNLADTSTKLDDRVSSHKLAKSKAGCFTGFERCDSGSLCLFTEPGGRGEMTAARADTAQYGATLNDRVVSVANYTDMHACFYPDPNHTGTWNDAGKTYGKYVVLKGDSSVIPQPFAASFSSHKLVTGTSQC